MASINRRSLALALGLCALQLAFSQTGPWSDAELAKPGSGERLIAAAGQMKAADAVAFLVPQVERIPPQSGRSAVWTFLARLHTLSGFNDKAAEAWLHAAQSSAGPESELCLLNHTRSLIAIGEFDSAVAVLQKLMINARETRTLREARFLLAALSAVQAAPDATEHLEALLGNPDFAEYRAPLLFLLHQVNRGGTYAARLQAEYPASPEARMADAYGALVASPLWLFETPIAVSTPPSNLSANEEAAAAVPEPTASPSPAPGGVDDASGRLLQLGLFRSRANAEALVKKVASKGFAASIADRLISGNTYFIVTVDAGTDPNTMVLRLKDAGFESFPLFN